MMNMMKIAGAFVLAAFLAPAYVHANDGFAALGAGGVSISRTGAIALMREVLDISCDEIHVSYDFVNESARDEDALVMFPLPPYPADFAESNVISHGQPSGFIIKVDGRAVTYDTEVKALQKGCDVTEALKAAGLTPEQIARLPFDKTLLNFDHELLIPKEQRDALTKSGLVVDGAPKWNIHVTYIWKQKFPANKTVHVEHVYQPFTAEGTFGGYPGYAEMGDYCLNEEQLRRLKELHANKENLDVFNQVPGTNLKYILTAANSWKDGIRDFRLRIHAKAEDEIVGLCFPAEVKKVSATTYEARLVNFKAAADLSVYFGNAKKCGSNGYGEPPATSPAQAPQTSASIRHALPNAAYPIELASTGKAQLKDGVFEESVAPGSATKTRIRLGKERAFGDVNADGTEDAVVTLVVDPGGSGTFTYLALVLNESGTARPLAAVLLGDRIIVKSMAIRSGRVTVNMLSRKPDEPMSAEPEVEVTRIFKLQGDTLIETK